MNSLLVLLVLASSLNAIDDKVSLNDLLNLNGGKFIEEAVLTNPRILAIRESGFKAGALYGFKDKALSLNGLLLGQDAKLRKIFDFSRLVIVVDKRILVRPPIIANYRDDIKISPTGDTIVEKDLIYRVLEPARLILQIPVWTDFLLIKNDQIHKIDKRIMPRNKIEKQIWQAAIKEGWSQGQNQATEIYHNNLKNIEKTLIGMGLYRSLVSRGILNEMFVANSELGLQISSSEMVVSGRTIRLTQPASFNQSPENWKPIVIRGGVR